MGGEGATPYEVLLHAAVLGDSMRFTRQDQVEETWRIMQPLLDAAPRAFTSTSRARGAPRPRTRSSPSTEAGASRGCSHERRDRRLSSRRPSGTLRRRRSRRSPTTRSSRTATRARWSRPDGAVDWLCVPSFDAPSVFGSLLDRQAGFFRFAPFGINHPAARAYEPGTNVLVDDVEDTVRVGRRPRRSDDGAVRARRLDPASHAAAGGRRRRAHAGADGRVHRGSGRDRPRLRAGVRLRTYGSAMGTGRG